MKNTISSKINENQCYICYMIKYRKAYLLLIFFFLVLHVYPQDNYKKLTDSLKYVEEVPYIRNCDDPIFWRIVSKGLDIVPHLIDKMTDTKQLDYYVPNFGGKYTVADIAYQALEEIIGDIPTFELLGIEFDKSGCGYCTFWWHVRESKKNRKLFLQAVRKWYNDNKDALVWVESSHTVTGDCFRPGGGHYEVNKHNENGSNNL